MDIFKHEIIFITSKKEFMGPWRYFKLPFIGFFNFVYPLISDSTHPYLLSPGIICFDNIELESKINIKHNFITINSKKKFSK
jgi:hypothetical protein